MRFLYVVVFFLTCLLGCGRAPQPIDGTGAEQTTAVTPSQRLFETPIFLADTTGTMHEGVAITSRSFSASGLSCVQSTQVVVGSPKESAFEDRLDAARTGMAKHSDEQAIKVAYVFKDNNVVGWRGSMLGRECFASAEDPAETHDGVGVARQASAGWYTDNATQVNAGNTWETSVHQCWSGYAYGLAHIYGAGTVVLRFQWYYPGIGYIYMAPDPISYTVGGFADRDYNWGNWFTPYSGLRGWYSVKVTNSTVDRIIVTPTLGCEL